MVEDGKSRTPILTDSSADNPTSLSLPDGASAPSQAEGKIFFNVSFGRKDAAHTAGLRWDPAVSNWYAPNTEIAEAFSASACEKLVLQQAHERSYFNVPFMQKDRAKAIGMRFDGTRKCWFAEGETFAALARTLFPPIFENVILSQPR